MVGEGLSKATFMLTGGWGFESSGGHVARDKTFKVQVTGPVTLDDLRWLVRECEGLEADSPVVVTGAKEYNQIDSEPARIEVLGKQLGPHN